MENSNTVYILDTNILWDITTLFSNKPKENVEKILKFFKKKTNEKFIILDLVWTEFATSIFQYGFPFDNYKHWYNQRETAFWKVFNRLKKVANVSEIRAVDICLEKEKEKEIEIEYVELAGEISLVKYSSEFVNDFYNEIKKKLEATKSKYNSLINNDYATLDFIKRQERFLKSGKFLDGKDPWILSLSLIYYKNNSNSNVRILTSDKFFEKAGNHICKNIDYYNIPIKIPTPINFEIVTINNAI